MIRRHTDEGSRLAEWMVPLARTSLQHVAPRRWRHVDGAIRLAEEVAPALGEDGDLLVAAVAAVGAGWAPQYAETGFASLDGARLVERLGGPSRLAALVAHYIASAFEAELRGLGGPYVAYEDEQTAVRDALWYCDLSVGPDGDRIGAEARLAEIAIRYGDDPIVGQWLEHRGPQLIQACIRTRKLLSVEV